MKELFEVLCTTLLAIITFAAFFALVYLIVRGIGWILSIITLMDIVCIVASLILLGWVASKHR